MRVLIAIPALNEASIIADNVRRLLAFVDERLPEWAVTVIVADNGSTDGTSDIVASLAAVDQRVRPLRLEQRGKGRAIRAAWQAADADVYVFMDADLATDIAALPELVRTAAVSGGATVGDRHARESQVERSFGRRLLSYGYRQFVRLVLGTHIGDLPCGFKAVAGPALREILPSVRDDGWFFDTELVVRLERAGYEVQEIPVRWREPVETGRRSRVRVPQLIVEYARQVWRLRRDLRTVGERREGRWFWLLVGLTMVLSSLPPLYAWWEAGRHGTHWLGSSFLSPGDFSYYLAMLGQARDGHWLFTNLFTLETMPAQLNAFWLVLGQLAGAANLPSVAAWQLARLLLIPVMAAASYGLFRQLLAEPRQRLVALGLLLLGGGFGPLLLVLGGRFALVIGWPIDLWVAEANGFLSATYTPHFLAAWALLAWSFSQLLRLLTRRDRGSLIMLAVAGATLSFVYPFLAVVTAIVPVGWWLRLYWQDRRINIQAVVPTLVLAVSGLPALGYYFLWSRLDNLTAAFTAANICETPAWWLVLLGLGLPLLLAVPGFWLLRQSAERRTVAQLFVIWFVMQLALTYAPLVFQRRLLMGLLLPLSALAAPTLVWGWDRLKNRLWPVRFMAVALVIVLILPAAVFAISRGLIGYAGGQSPVYFLSDEEDAALSWAQENGAPTDAYVGGLRAMYLLPGVAGRRVLAGHWVATVKATDKVELTRRFFESPDTLAQARFMAQIGLTHVWCDAATVSAGSCPEVGESFILEYERDGIRILRLRAAP